MQEWQTYIDGEEGEFVFTCSRRFENITYRIDISYRHYQKSSVFNVALSSGRKKKSLSIYHDKPIKESAGLKALFWAKKTILEFPEFYKENYIGSDKNYLCIRWTDNRRRNIYSILKKEGFHFSHIEGVKTLVKQF